MGGEPSKVLRNFSGRVSRCLDGCCCAATAGHGEITTVAWCMRIVPALVRNIHPHRVCQVGYGYVNCSSESPADTCMHTGQQRQSFLPEVKIYPGIMIESPVCPNPRFIHARRDVCVFAMACCFLGMLGTKYGMTCS